MYRCLPLCQEDVVTNAVAQVDDADTFVADLEAMLEQHALGEAEARSRSGHASRYLMGSNLFCMTLCV